MMDKNLQDKLFEKYPKILRLRRIEVGNGWYHIVDGLCESIQVRLDWKNQRIPKVDVTKIREKFGSMEFYHEGGDDTINGMVSAAEAISRKTCESCGAQGMQRDIGWIFTLCEGCYEDLEPSSDPKSKSDPEQLTFSFSQDYTENGVDWNVTPQGEQIGYLDVAIEGQEDDYEEEIELYKTWGGD